MSFKERPHRAINGRTPHQAYTALPKAEPTLTLDLVFYRVRTDRVDKVGKVSYRYAGKLRHLGIGRHYKNRRVTILSAGPKLITIERATGTIIAEHHLDITRDYQPPLKDRHHHEGRRETPLNDHVRHT